MSTGRLELKVGLFVIVLLGLAAVMSVRFNETGFGLRKTYSLTLQTVNAGAIIPDSAVIMSGVKIGYVDHIELRGDGGEVYIEVELYPKYRDMVRHGAVFRIKSSGFLGDQYVDVLPSVSSGEPIKSDEIYDCESPLDMEQIGQRFEGLLVKMEGAVGSIDSFMKKMDKGVLSEESLTNITVMITQFREATEKADRVISTVDQLLATNGPAVTEGIAGFSLSMNNFSTFTKELQSALATNGPAVSQSVTNFAAFTKRLHATAGELEQLIATNTPTVQKAAENIEAFTLKLEKTTDDLQSTLANNRTNITFILKNMALATESINGITDSANTILNEIESGKGLAGGFLKNEEMRGQFQAMMTNMNSTAIYLSNLTSNLNKRGIFYKPKPESFVIPPRSVRPK